MMPAQCGPIFFYKCQNILHIKSSLIFSGDFPWPMALSQKMIGPTLWRMSQKLLEICSMDTTLGSVPILEVGCSHFFYLITQRVQYTNELQKTRIWGWIWYTPSPNIDLDFFPEQNKPTIKSINITFQQWFLMKI